MVDLSDRRRLPRHTCHLRVGVALEGQPPIHGRSADVSGSGIGVLLDQAVAVDSRVTLHLRLVMGWSEGNFLQLPARVMWCNETDQGHLVGAEFLELDDDRAQRLRILLRVLAGELDFPKTA